MKKTLSSILICLAISMTSFAGGYVPEPHPANEFNLSYGRASLPSIAMVVGGSFATVFTFGLATMDRFWTTGTVTAGYYRYLNNHVALGGDVIYERLCLEMRSYSGKDENGNALYENELTPHPNSFISVVPGVKLPWFNNSHFSMYSKLNAGFAVAYSPRVVTTEEGSDGQPEENVSEASTDFTYAIQFSPIGMDFGGQSFRGFIELGLGMQGLICGGIKYAF